MAVTVKWCAVLGKNSQHDKNSCPPPAIPTFQGDDDVCQGGVNFLDVGVPVNPGTEDLGQHPGGLPPLLLSPPDVPENPEDHLPSSQLSEPEKTNKGYWLPLSWAAGLPDDSLQDTADGAESPERGDPDGESGLVASTESQQPVHGPLSHQQPAQVVPLQRQAGHHVQPEVHLGLAAGQTVDGRPDLNPQHQLHHPGEGGADQSDELDQWNLVSVLPDRELDAVTQVEQLLLLVFDLGQGQTFLGGFVLGEAREVAVVHEAALLVLTLQEEKLDLMS